MSVVNCSLIALHTGSHPQYEGLDSPAEIDWPWGMPMGDDLPKHAESFIRLEVVNRICFSVCVAAKAFDIKEHIRCYYYYYKRKEMGSLQFLKEKRCHFLTQLG